jgi:protease I
MADLSGRTIAFVATDGVEQVEYTEPRKAVEAAGATAELLSLDEGEIQGYNHLDKGDSFAVDAAVKAADPERYDALVLPGGVANPDRLRVDPDVRRFVSAFFKAGKPVAAICHAPWTLIDAGHADGRRLTSFPSLQTDLRNAGAEWVDEEVVIDDGLITSRKPDDLPAFCSALVDAAAAA